MMDRQQMIVERLAVVPQGTCVLLDQLDADLNLDRNAITQAVSKLITRKAAYRQSPGCYALTDQGRQDFANGKVIRSGPAGPHKGAPRSRPNTLLEKIWLGLRQGKRVSTNDLLELAQTGLEDAARSNTLNYLNRLARAGLVVRFNRRRSDPLEWLLKPSVSSGPQAPRYRNGRIYDPNTSFWHDLEKPENKPATKGAA